MTEEPYWWEVADALYLAACREETADGGPEDAGDDHAPTAEEGLPPLPGRSPAPRDDEAVGHVPASAVRQGLPTSLAALSSRHGAVARDRGSSHAGASVTLANSLGLERALRPLRLSVSSPYAVKLDEEATAERAAVDGLWLPQTRSEPEPLLELLLVVDESPSMALWQDTTLGVRRMLEHTAAFRIIRMASRAVGTAAPLPPTGPNRLLVVLTDAASPAWRTGQAAAQLHAWSRTSPTVVFHLLPQHLWELTLPSSTRVGLRVPTRGAPNLAYQVEVLLPPHDLDRGAAASPLPSAGAGNGSVVPVPVVELRAGALGRWAELVAATGGDRRHDLAVLLTTADGDLLARPREDDTQTAPAASEDSARESVARFRSAASPTAFTLARRLAAAPLNLPVMRLVQRTVSSAQPWNLSEIMLAGLIRRIDTSTDAEDPYQVCFDFLPGTREELLALGSRAETLAVLQHVEQHVGPGLEARWDGGAALVTPQAHAGTPPLTQQTRRFLPSLHTALTALSGPFLARADEVGSLLSLSASESPDPSRPDPGDEPPATPPTSVAVEVGQNDPRSPRQPVLRPSAAPGITSPGGNVTLGQPPATGGRSPQEAPRLWGNVPQRNRNFTGRGDLLELLAERLSTGLAAVLPEALHGMGGVGKSQIAVEYLYLHSHDYSLVWWIPAEQPNQVIQSLIELGDRMGLKAGSDVSAIRTVLDALRTGVPYRDWILVFDNAEDPRQIRKYFPTNGPGRILVTSRNAQWSSLASSLEVNVFAREESVALLRRRSNIPESAADQLATALGDLPLAVEQASVWLAETGMPAQQYLELFERKWTELLRSDPPPDYEMPVAAAWNVSLERLQEDHLDALNLLQVCAFFAPEPISWDLFSAVRGIDVPEALQATLEDPVKLGRAVREIGRYALARIDHRQSTIQLHRLVQRVLVDQMAPDEQGKMRHAAHQLLMHADPRNPQRIPHWSRYSDLLPHVQASGAVDCDDPWTRRLVLNELRFLVARGDFSGAQSFSEQARTRWNEGLGPEHADVLAADQVRAEALRCRGRYPDAYDLQKDLVDRFTRVHGEHHEDTQLALSLLGIHLRLRGDFYGARELDKRTYDTSMRVFGPDEPNTLQAAHNYAVSLRLAGDVQRALELDDETWQRRVQVIGEDHVFTLGTLSAYYLDLQELGRYADCLEGHEHLAARSRDQLGEEHPLTVMINAELSVTRRKAGDHEGAYRLTSRLKEIVERRLTPDNRDALRVNLVHATDLRQVGQLQAARALGTDVMERHIRKFGERHPHTYATFLNLAVTLRLLGEVEQALELDQKALDGLSAALSPDHPRTLVARMNLASDLFALGNSRRAYRIDRDAVSKAATAYGPDHPASLAVQLNYAADLKAKGEAEAGRELYDKTIEKYRKQLGADHPATRDAKRGIRANIDIDLVAL
ncbi:FxSxx-COOH system tetratricopeptide repeat protein [Streptomyces umbrinus]|uniref:FxSxx-COOH system tetratricopeptide repeat protein n=1 Tax=Streptomyces umbrinus TaxID=67370 RepID=UPI0033F6CA24|nr:FxSxx-COOH system tetratricopeptide repeat protein [Streptomyces phaeochromogenes]